MLRDYGRIIVGRNGDIPDCLHSENQYCHSQSAALAVVAKIDIRIRNPLTRTQILPTTGPQAIDVATTHRSAPRTQLEAHRSHTNTGTSFSRAVFESQPHPAKPNLPGETLLAKPPPLTFLLPFRIVLPFAFSRLVVEFEVTCCYIFIGMPCSSALHTTTASLRGFRKRLEKETFNSICWFSIMVM